MSSTPLQANLRLPQTPSLGSLRKRRLALPLKWPDRPSKAELTGGQRTPSFMAHAYTLLISFHGRDEVRVHGIGSCDADDDAMTLVTVFFLKLSKMQKWRNHFLRNLLHHGPHHRHGTI